MTKASEIYGRQIAIFVDQQAAGTQAGEFTSGDWRTRVLNTTKVNTSVNSNISLGTNQFTLKAGTYHIRASAPGYKCGAHQLKLRNITDSTDDIIGQGAYSGNVEEETPASLEGIISLSADKTFELQHRCDTTRATVGLGVPSNFGVVEIFATVFIEKIK